MQVSRTGHIRWGPGEAFIMFNRMFPEGIIDQRKSKKGPSVMEIRKGLSLRLLDEWIRAIKRENRKGVGINSFMCVSLTR